MRSTKTHEIMLDNFVFQFFFKKYYTVYVLDLKMYILQTFSGQNSFKIKLFSELSVPVIRVSCVLSSSDIFVLLEEPPMSTTWYRLVNSWL